MSELSSVWGRVAFNAGIEVLGQMAMAAAVTIEIRDDASRIQNQAAVAALQALAEGARDLLLTELVAEQETGP